MHRPAAKCGSNVRAFSQSNRCINPAQDAGRAGTGTRSQKPIEAATTSPTRAGPRKSTEARTSGRGRPNAETNRIRSRATSARPGPTNQHAGRTRSKESEADHAGGVGEFWPTHSKGARRQNSRGSPAANRAPTEPGAM
ncbi:hypothetical protein NL676_012663 [Syzygium grande]|nr:hypothetical protein NL676_012663 [Syzygium grande]